jgi:hypothetical protein
MKKIVLVSGKLQTGKNQFADYLEQAYTLDKVEVVQDCFAQYLKDECKEDFKPLTKFLNRIANQIKSLCDPMLIYNHKTKKYDIEATKGGPEESDFMYFLQKLRTHDENFYEDKNDITRILLQTYGTEIFRKRVDNDYWVKRMISKIKESDKKVFIITDVRFPNEIDLVMEEDEFDVCTIRVERDMDRSGPEHKHPSETSLDGFNGFNYIVDNNGTLEELWNAMGAVYNELKNGISEDEHTVVDNKGNMRRVWNIDTTKLPTKKATEYLKNIIKKYKRQIPEDDTRYISRNIRIK